ncbi:small ribosomal subunit protein eS8-like [Tenrec ecaudatus]|uniref:small ribosomal subunit protein eS8-like n=1 Tax=Tenrec ecaudatus TaxID=94439 RepID=UPI003F5A79C0
MGISRDCWHQCCKTQSEHVPCHTKPKWCWDTRLPTLRLARLHPHASCEETTRSTGTTAGVGNFCDSESRILTIRVIEFVYNAFNSAFRVRTKTLVKNRIILIDSTPYQQRHESHCALPLGYKKGANLASEEGEILSKKRITEIQKSTKGSQEIQKEI